MQKVAKERLTQYKKADIMKIYAMSKFKTGMLSRPNFDSLDYLHDLMAKREDLLFMQLGM